MPVSSFIPRAIGLVVTIGFSVAAGYWGQPLVSNNTDAINTIVTVFSILAGFLIAVITFLGDPGARGWDQLQLDKKSMEAKLWRHEVLFYLYLVTLGLALFMFVLPEEYEKTTLWLERLFVGSAVFVFLASFALPQSLSALQMERYQSKLDDDLPQVLKDLHKEE
ncbi:hypothetical protein TG4357_03302 [Thalassovita gelatinovora]|uniref:Uncharacterized protein n=1 Tax=Thalassovita gelatinovora TaxID=53501 RepID=A0A0P1G2G1_THAGE|nr:hypothetical protein [Thalassovita gelatinovora]CUH67951.1 hypothetical protein TG4357_03302 [Thalassovita gelatinovora]SEQ26148.1 hypothetical protein SAMN04488043_104173 [Thalassovita gelatinovora]